MKATAERINDQYVMTRTKTGAPRKFRANIGEVAKRHMCYCPKGGQGCSHETALYTLLHQEAAAMTAQVVPNVA